MTQPTLAQSRLLRDLSKPGSFLLHWFRRPKVHRWTGEEWVDGREHSKAVMTSVRKLGWIDEVQKDDVPGMDVDLLPYRLRRHDPCTVYALSDTGREAAAREPKAAKTRKPWPCCGKELSYSYRPADEAICPDCRRLMEDGERYRAAEAESETELVVIHRPSIPSRAGIHETDTLRAAMIDVAKVAMDGPANAADQELWDPKDALRVYGNQRDVGSRVRGRGRPEVVHALNALQDAVEACLVAAYDNGHAEGRRLVQRVQDGEVGYAAYVGPDT